MKKISHLDIIGKTPSAEELQRRTKRPIRVVLDNIRSLYNVGSIFRTSDAVGIEKIYLCGISGKPPRVEIQKAALGADQSVPWEYVANAVEIVNKLKKEGFKIVALEHTDCSSCYFEATYEFPLCLIVGHEIVGVSDEVIDLVDLAIDIPMAGLKQSLNVAVAYGIAIYEIIKYCP